MSREYPSTRDIRDVTETDLALWLKDHDIAAYRAGQVFRWIYHRSAKTFSEMTDLSKDLRQRLSRHFTIGHFKPDKTQTSQDASKKYRFRLDDGHCVETVLIPERGHWTLCISSQVGCPIGCRFCLTGTMGLVRNLKPSEIIRQVCAVKALLPPGQPLTNIVFMGMGEPLANYDNVLQALSVIMGKNGLQFSHRRVTLSTAGIAPAIDALGKATRLNLAISLNAADDETRSRIMPINRTYSLEDLLASCKRFPVPRGRRLTVEYVLLSGVNDSTDDAVKLSRLLRPLRAKVNLIPFNPFEGSPFERPGEDAIQAFQDILIEHQYTVLIRWSKGQDIGAACGQLGTATT
jgi:23S rRNA (adenine2503-C2)-methyltransferase